MSKTEISPEALAVKNLEDLTADVMEKAKESPGKTAKVLADIVIETNPNDKPDENNANLAFAECFTGGDLTQNAKNIVKSIEGTAVEEPFRNTLTRFSNALELAPEKQREVIQDHYRELLAKAAEVEESLASLE